MRNAHEFEFAVWQASKNFDSSAWYIRPRLIASLYVFRALNKDPGLRVIVQGPVPVPLS